MTLLCFPLHDLSLSDPYQEAQFQCFDLRKFFWASTYFLCSLSTSFFSSRIQLLDGLLVALQDIRFGLVQIMRKKNFEEICKINN